MAEQFQDPCFDFDEILKELIVRDRLGEPDASWLMRSRGEASQFWRELVDYAALVGGAPLKSCPFEFYDFYNDLVVRNLGQDRTAFAWFEQGFGWHRLSFDALHRQSDQLVNHWQLAGVDVGASLCLILPMGPDFVVSLMTAYRLGLVVSVLNAQGQGFVENRLNRLEPDHIVADSHYVGWLGKFRGINIPAPDPKTSYGPAQVISHSYKAEQTAAKFFSPFSTEPTEPSSVRVDHLYLRAIRDSLLSLRLAPGDCVAAPGYNFLQYQPWLLLTSFFGRACFAHTDIGTDGATMDRLASVGATVVGVSNRLRDKILERPSQEPPGWKLWFRDPSEPLDWNAWESFRDQAQLGKILTTNLVANSAFGGAVLFSAARVEGGLLSVLPAAGVKCELTDVGMSGQPAVGGTGVLQSEEPGDSENHAGRFVITQRGEAYSYVSSLDMGRNAHVYPVEEVCAAARELPFVRDCTVVSGHSGAEINDVRVAVLVFLEPDVFTRYPDAAPGWEGELRRAITVVMGRDYLPERVEFYPLAARMNAGQIDHVWAREQYHGGGLYRKAKDPIFVELATLRSAVCDDESLPVV